MIAFLSGLLIGYFYKGYSVSKREKINSLQRHNEEEQLTQENLLFLKSKFQINLFLNFDHYITARLGQDSNAIKGKWSFESRIILGELPFDVVWTTEYQAHSYRLIEFVGSSLAERLNKHGLNYKITVRNLGTSAFEFNYKQVEIIKDDKVVLKALCRDFQHDNKDWFEVSELDRDELLSFLSISRQSIHQEP